MAVKEKELPDNATTEQVEEFIDQLLVDEKKEEEAEAGSEKKEPGEASEDTTEDTTEAGDEKSASTDSGVLSDDEELKDAEETGSKDEGSEETSEDGSEDEKSSEEEAEEESEWLDDDLRAEVSALGITDEQLSEFTSREELDRALRFLDLGAMKAGKEALGSEDQEENGEKRSRDESGRFKSAKKKEESEKDTASSYEVGLDPDVYDEDVVKAFTGLRDHFDARLEQLEKAGEARARELVETQFDAIVDSLDQPKLFGKSGEETKAELANRQKLFDAQHVYSKGLWVLGRNATLNKSLVSRVLNMEFADHLSKQQQKKLTRKISKQSRMRLGAGGIKSTDKYTGPPEQDPELREMYERLEAESSG